MNITSSLKPGATIQRGFTLIELIMTMVIVGILAILVAPRFFDANVFKQKGFSDEVRSVLRYAQKTAIAQRKFVCVVFGLNSVTLTIDTASDPGVVTTTTCPAAASLAIPGKSTNIASSSDASFTTPAAGTKIYFNALGKPDFTSVLNVNVNGNTFQVESETGYVH